MTYLLPGIASLLLYLVSFNVAAVSIYECEDDDGNRTYEEHCPPGTSPVQEKKFYTGSSSAPASATDISATLYSVPDCEPCAEIRDFLTARDVLLTEKNVNDNLDLQTELKDVAGELTVPITVIGEAVIKGYDRAALTNALTAVGYVDPEAAAKPDEPAPTATAPATKTPVNPEDLFPPEETTTATE